MPTPSTPHHKPWQLVFETELGWMYLVAGERGAEALRFGFESLSELRATLSTTGWTNVTVLNKRTQEIHDLGEAPAWLPELVAALRDFAAGEENDFTRFPIQLPPKTPFQQRVIDACRAIPRGETLTYGQLAAKARAPGAARAVGQVMAKNCLPLLIPCHRVVGSNGLHGFSAPGGLATKQRLLELEQGLTSLV
jgi:methylated-DNA-[protein]-cysteine S-methyltransferase